MIAANTTKSIGTHDFSIYKYTFDLADSGKEDRLVSFSTSNTTAAGGGKTRMHQYSIVRARLDPGATAPFSLKYGPQTITHMDSHFYVGGALDSKNLGTNILPVLVKLDKDLNYISPTDVFSQYTHPGIREDDGEMDSEVNSYISEEEKVS